MVVGGFAASAVAEVQSIRLSGDIRLRGYLLNSAGADVAGGTFVQSAGTAQFIVQRTRVTLAADLAEQVLAVVTLKADGNWGQTSTDQAGRTWNLGVAEATVQFRELFGSPATLKVGRQYLNYGTGLILSSADQTYSFDGGRLVLDYQPVTIDVVCAQTANDQSVAASAVGGQADLVFVNAKYEARGAAVRVVEGYFGWAPQTGSSQTFALSANHPSPLLVGVRADLAPADGWTAAVEGAYEFGNAGLPVGYARSLSAFLANAVVKYRLPNVAWAPVVNAGYTYAQGGGGGLRHDFVPWFDMADGYNGYVLAPALSNIQIFNLGAAIQPAANLTVAVQGYYYLRADRGSDVFSNPNADFGGPAFVNNLNNAIGAGSAAASILNARELGWELDTIVGYDYSRDVRCQLVYGVFIPNAQSFQGVANRVVNEIRGELTVKF